MKFPIQMALFSLTALLTGIGFAQDGSHTSVEVPRTAEGYPDLNGTWDNGSGIDFVRPQNIDGSICVTGCPQPESAPTPTAVRLPPDRPSYRPEFMEKVRDLEARQVEEDPVLRCRNPGLPRIGPPDKIVQIPGQIVFLYDDVNGNYFRIIPTDGRGYREGVEETYLGDSVGRWEGDTLVVETVNLIDETWLTDDGSFHTADLRVVERLTRTDDTLEWQATSYDPAVLAEPWVQRPRIAHLTGQELVEAAPCIERDLPHMQDLSHHDNLR
ncbi:MAG: hypothetical protein OXQ29_16305 [Rhodospirillaceae bacterium]|nr:hypothetical protein [Rhodospirillaceae bacterium]